MGGRHPAHLPTPLVELLRPDPARPARMPRVTRSTSGGRGDVFAQKAAYLARYVEQAPEGTRNGRLFWAACEALRDGHPAETLDLLEGAAMVAGLSEREAAATIASARRMQGRAS